MLSVVIATQDSERALVPTLAALVAGAVAGLIREVIVTDPGAGDGSAQIADGAGCRVMISPESRGARLAAAAGAARAPWLLFLRPGAVPDATWIDETSRFIEEAARANRADDRAAVFRRPASAFRPTVVEALALLHEALLARPGPDQGLLIAKSFYDRLGGHRPDLAEPESDLIRRLGRRRTMLLRAGVLTAR